MQAATVRLGRPADLLRRHGPVEREVVAAAADGDRSRLGPRSLAPPTRFVVDHARCPVLLVWPDEPPSLTTMPPPPPAKGEGPHGPRA